MLLEIDLVKHNGRSLIGKAVGEARKGRPLSRVAEAPGLAQVEAVTRPDSAEIPQQESAAPSGFSV
jgi:hypothetical protein